jgi:hypothetical protein
MTAATVAYRAGQTRNPPFSTKWVTSAFGRRWWEAFPQGTVHEAREDLQAAVRSNLKVLMLWESLTPLGRNEFICWVDDAKQPTTRRRRIERTCGELLEGRKRPCCWAGCIHRTDKAPSRWQKAVLIDQKGKEGS